MNVGEGLRGKETAYRRGSVGLKVYVCVLFLQQDRLPRTGTDGQRNCLEPAEDGSRGDGVESHGGKGLVLTNLNFNKRGFKLFVSLK